MVEKTNQPYSYMIQDIERAEKELANAVKKIKVLEDEIKRLKKENDQLVLVSIQVAVMICLCLAKERIS